MESTHRYRLLIYFAALVLCLSVCFANAEEPNSSATPVNRPVFETSPLHATFLSPLRQSYIPAPASIAAPPVSQDLLQQVTASAQRSHGIFGHVANHLSLSRRKTSLVLAHVPAASRALENASSSGETSGQSE